MGYSGHRTYQFGDNKLRRKKHFDDDEEEDDAFAREVYGQYDHAEVMRKLDDQISRFSNFKSRGTPPPYSMTGYTIHAKLEISHPQDKSEMQADELAESFMHGDAEQSQEILSQQVPEISRSGEGGMETPDGFDQQLQSTKGQGQKLDEGTKSELEEHTGADLSGVNIHTNSQAHDMSESINAKAFAHGQDIYFKEGNYNPDSKEGKELLAHEVAHTVQQGEGKVQMKVQRQVDPSGKKEYKKLDVSYEASVIKPGGVFLGHDDSGNWDKTENFIDFGETVEVLWESTTGWAFVYSPNDGKDGYVKRTSIFRLNTLDEVVIEDTSVNQKKIDKLDEMLNKGNPPENDITNLLKTFTYGESQLILKNKDVYKELFISCMTNKEMRNVVMILKFPLDTKLDWMIDEGTDAELVFSLVDSITIDEIDKYSTNTQLQSRLAKEIGDKEEKSFRDKLEGIKNQSGTSAKAAEYRKRRINRKGIYGSEKPDFAGIKARYEMLSKRLEGTEQIFNYLYTYNEYEKNTFPAYSDPRQSMPDQKKKALSPEANRFFDQYVAETQMELKDPSYSDRALNEELSIHDFASAQDYKEKEVEFENLFTEYAVATARQMLNVNEKLIISEINRYFNDAAVQAIFDALNTPRELYDEAHQKRKKWKKSMQDWDAEPSEQTHKRKNWKKKKKEADAATTAKRKELEKQFPILADKTIKNKDLAEADLGTLRNLLVQAGLDRLEDVQTTRDNLKSDPELVYKLENVTSSAKQALGIVDGGFDIQSLIVGRHKIKKDISESNVNTAKAVFAIGLGLLSLPVGGWGGAVIGGLGTAIGVEMTIEQIGEYNVMHAAANTAFDRAKALTSNDPSLFWLAISIAATVLDVALLTKTFATLAKSASLIKGVPTATTIEAFNQEVETVGKEAGLADDTIKMIEQAAETKAVSKGNDIGEILWDGVPVTKNAAGVETRNVAELFGNSGSRVYQQMKTKVGAVTEHVLGGGANINEKAWAEVVDAISKTDLPLVTKNQIAGQLFWEQINISKYRNAGYKVFSQVRLYDTISKQTAILDIVAKNADEVIYVECKIGDATLNANQEVVYEALKTNPGQLQPKGTQGKLAFGDKQTPPLGNYIESKGKGIE